MELIRLHLGVERARRSQTIQVAEILPVQEIFGLTEYAFPKR